MLSHNAPEISLLARSFSGCPWPKGLASTMATAFNLVEQLPIGGQGSVGFVTVLEDLQDGAVLPGFLCEVADILSIYGQY